MEIVFAHLDAMRYDMDIGTLDPNYRPKIGYLSSETGCSRVTVIKWLRVYERTKGAFAPPQQGRRKEQTKNS